MRGTGNRYRPLGDSYKKREWPWQKLQRLWFDAGTPQREGDQREREKRYGDDNDIWRALMGM